MLDPDQLKELEQSINTEFLGVMGVEALGEPRPPEVLYHYTTAAGLHGILRDQELWATNVLYMNDSSELTDAIAIFRNVLDEERKGHSEANGLWLVINRLAENLTRFPMDYFVCCFCKGDDVLSQWRGYGSQGGYCLEFRTPDLAARSAGPACRLRGVEYDDDRKAQRLRKRIRIVLNHLRNAAGQLNPDNTADAQMLNQFTLRIVGLFAGIFCEMKNRAFAAEEEWRLICMQPSVLLGYQKDILRPVQFRISNSIIVPFVKLSWPRENDIPTLPVAKVRSGPGPRPELSQRVVHDLLACTGFRDVAVEGSNVPLRV